MCARPRAARRPSSSASPTSSSAKSRSRTIIDPQLQAINWIAGREEPNGLVRLTLDQKNYLDKVVRALEEGLPMVIENMGEEIDAVLDNMIARAFIKKGSKLQVKLGDRDTDIMVQKTAEGELNLPVRVLERTQALSRAEDGRK